jgi:hypothetical protein
MNTPLSLKVGKTYRMQNGGTATITGLMPPNFSHYPGLFTGQYYAGVTSSGRSMTWPEDGDANTCEYHDFSGYTLVEEVPKAGDK